MSTISSTRSLPTSTSTPASYVNPVASSSTYAGLSTMTAKLGLESSIVATLGGSSSSTPLYDAVGLMNSIITAGQSTSTGTTASTAASTATNTTAATPSTATTTATTGTTSAGSTSSTSGIYTASGTVQGTTTNVNANWATVLKTNPSAASTVVADSSIQSILSSISITA